MKQFIEQIWTRHFTRTARTWMATRISTCRGISTSKLWFCMAGSTREHGGNQRPRLNTFHDSQSKPVNLSKNRDFDPNPPLANFRHFSANGQDQINWHQRLWNLHSFESSISANHTTPSSLFHYYWLIFHMAWIPHHPTNKTAISIIFPLSFDRNFESAIHSSKSNHIVE